MKRERGRKSGIVVSAFFLGFLIVICYARTIFGGFIYDDTYYVRDNAAIRSLKNIPAFFTKPESAVAHVKQSRLIYRPLTTTFFALEYFAFGGASPMLFHLVSIALFLLIVGLLMGLGRLLYEDSGPVIFLGGFVAAHPLCTETVGWISAQPTLLCAVSMILSVGAFLLASKGTRVRKPAFMASWLFAAAAMLFKEVGIMTPLLLLAAHAAYGDDEKKARRYQTIGLAAAASVIYLVVRVILLDGLGGSGLYTQSLSGHIVAVLSVVPRYLQRFLLPLDLRVFYSLPDGSLWRAFIGLIFFVGAPVAAWLFRKKKPAASLGFALAFLAYLPASNIIPTGMPTAERYFFLPLIGLAVAGADILSPAMRGPKSGFALLIMVTAGCCFAALTFQRAGVWGSEVRFWQRAAAEQPALSMSYYNLALAHAGRGELEEAETNYKKVLSMNPDHARAANNLGIVLARQERYGEAEPYLQKAVDFNPGDWRAVENLIKVQLKQNRREEAAESMLRLLVESKNPAVEKMAAALMESGVLSDEMRERIAQALSS